MTASPLYFVPVGGHAQFFDTARLIAAGDLLPGNRPFTENSPLFPYIIAILIRLFGENYLICRLVTIAVDCITVRLIQRLASRHFGSRVGWWSAMLYAVYAPAVFYSAELFYVPYVTCLITACMLALASEKPFGALLGGLFIGLATDLMPTALPIACVAVIAELLMRRGRRAVLVSLGVGLSIAPVTLANYVMSGQLVLLTTSAGHNFYIGHNAQAQPGYFLPSRIAGVQAPSRGNVFDNMKAVAETVSGKALADKDVSSFYFSHAFAYITAHPVDEIALVGRRFLAIVNSFEATTYADYYLQRQLSPVLRMLLGWELLLPLAIIGAGCRSVRRAYWLYVPIGGTVIVLMAFFYLSRLRMPVVPSLAILAACGIVETSSTARRRAFRNVGIRGLAFAAALVVARLPLAKHDSSNEWNKIGAVLRATNRLAEADEAFKRAEVENPANPNTYLNQAKLADQLGDQDRARLLKEKGEMLSGDGHGADFVNELKVPEE